MLFIEVVASVIAMYFSIYWIEKSRKNELKIFINNCIIITLICYIVSIFNRNLTILPYIVLAFFFTNKMYKNRFKTAFLIGISVVINYLAIYLCSFLQYKIVNYVPTEMNKTIMILLYLLIIIIVYAISKIISIIINIRDIDFTNKNIYLKLITYILIIFMILTIYNVLVSDPHISNDIMRIYSIFIVITATMIMILITIILKASYKEIELEAKNQELFYLQQNYSNIENYYDEMRKFKHDYVNIISTLAGFIEDNDMESLKIYFEKNIMHLTEKIEKDSVKLDCIKNIKQVELKGLLTVKLMQINKKNADVSVEIIEEIDKINWDIIDMSRVLGILLDNAIEAIENSKFKKFQLAILKNKGEVVIIIKNSFEGERLSIQRIYQKGFSTKGSNRGLGLTNVKEIIDRNPNVNLETLIENNEFTQVVKIKD